MLVGAVYVLGLVSFFHLSGNAWRTWRFERRGVEQTSVVRSNSQSPPYRLGMNVELEQYDLAELDLVLDDIVALDAYWLRQHFAWREIESRPGDYAWTQWDAIIFDMPPTALTLRFFSLPAITRIWLDALLKLRRQIYEKKEIVSKIQFGSREIEQDKVSSRLTDMISVHHRLRTELTGGSTQINLVLNPDRLSFAEARRICGKLEEINMQVDALLINKVTEQSRLDEIEAEFSDFPIHRIPLSPVELSGLGALETHIKKASIFSDPIAQGEENHAAAN